MDKPKVSVLMPVYNGERYLRPAIESILIQSYSDFEFIIINDGSSDKSEEIIKSYNDHRIRYIKNETNIKLVETLNKGLKLVQGDYIVRMDCDDISHEDRIKKQVEFMEANPDVGVCGSWIKAFGNLRRSHTNKYYSQNDLIEISYLFWGSIAHPSVIIRKKYIDEFNLQYDNNYTHAEDFALWSKCIGKFKFANIPEVLLNYRISENNIGVKYNDQQTKSTEEALKNNMAKFGINFTQQEFEDHLAIVFSKRHIEKNEFLKRANEWLLRMVEYNSKNGIYERKAFNIVIQDYKYRLLFSNPYRIIINIHKFKIKGCKRKLILILKAIYSKFRMGD